MRLGLMGEIRGVTRIWVWGGGGGGDHPFGGGGGPAPPECLIFPHPQYLSPPRLRSLGGGGGDRSLPSPLVTPLGEMQAMFHVRMCSCSLFPSILPSYFSQVNKCFIEAHSKGGNECEACETQIQAHPHPPHSHFDPFCRAFFL